MRWAPILMLSLTMPLAGCAAILGSHQKDFEFNSNPQQADVFVNGSRVGSTPMKLRLDNHKAQEVVFRKEGYKEVSCKLEKGVGAGWVILDVLGGLVPIVIDAATNSWSQVKGSSCTGTLEPVVQASR
jgi:hypothetical protein